jgi:hypothetical protein
VAHEQNTMLHTISIVPVCLLLRSVTVHDHWMMGYADTLSAVSPDGKLPGPMLQKIHMTACARLQYEHIADNPGTGDLQCCVVAAA